MTPLPGVKRKLDQLSCRGIHESWPGQLYWKLYIVIKIFVIISVWYRINISTDSMQNLIFLVLVVATIFSVSAHVTIIPPGPYVLKPGIIRATIDELNITTLNIPRGGAIIQPLLPVNNSDDVTFSLNVTGQACDIYDPLILMYERLDPESGLITMTLPDDFFYLTLCGVQATEVELASLERWVIQLHWDGEKFVNTDDSCVPE